MEVRQGTGSMSSQLGKCWVSRGTSAKAPGLGRTWRGQVTGGRTPVDSEGLKLWAEEGQTDSSQARKPRAWRVSVEKGQAASGAHARHIRPRGEHRGRSRLTVSALPLLSEDRGVEALDSWRQVTTSDSPERGVSRQPMADRRLPDGAAALGEAGCRVAPEWHLWGLFLSIQQLRGRTFHSSVIPPTPERLPRARHRALPSHFVLQLC